MNKLLIAELNNKLFLRKAWMDDKIVCNKNFLVSGSNFLLIKNLIELELFTGKRPKIIVSFVKKSLVINLKGAIKFDQIVLLQKNPVVWKRYLSQYNLYEYYNIPPFLSNKSGLNISNYSKLSNYNNWFKSAYLD